MLAVAAASVMKAYHRDELATGGILAWSRHPIYAAWIVLLLPGLMLFTRSWPLLLTPLAAYAAFKSSIHEEDDYLAERFGRDYRDYRARVPELFPRRLSKR